MYVYVSLYIYIYIFIVLLKFAHKSVTRYGAYMIPTAHTFFCE